MYCSLQVSELMSEPDVSMLGMKTQGHTDVDGEVVTVVEVDVDVEIEVDVEVEVEVLQQPGVTTRRRYSVAQNFSEMSSLVDWLKVLQLPLAG